MKKITYSILLTLSFVTLSCNKTKKSSKTLQGSTWEISSLTIDEIKDTTQITLTFDEGNIYNEVLLGEWKNPAQASSVSFAWQFRDKGKTFEISNQSEGDDALQCSTLSGIYSVENLSSSEMKISSKSSIGFNNELVEITLEKK